MPTAIELCNERSTLESQRSPFYFLAQEIHDILGPANAFLGAETPIMDWNDTRDTTARRMAQFYANGLASLAFPKHDDFFAAEPPMRYPGDSAKKYYHEVTEEMQLMLEESNFYDQIPQTLFEGGVYGTGLMKIAEDTETNGAYFAHQCFGTYFIKLDSRGRLSAVYRDLSLTVPQLLEYIGYESLDKLPTELQAAYKEPTLCNKKFDFLHVVKKLRPEEVLADKKAFGDYMIYPKTKTILREDRHAFMPFFVRRHAVFSNWVYGYGPGWMALEDGHQASEASRLFEAFASRSTFPSVKASGSMEEQIRLGAGQVTWVDSTSAGEGVEAWADVGDYRAVQELLMSKHGNIEQAFFADLFRGVVDSNRVYSATQAQIMENNQNQQLYPTALRIESETGRPMLDALFQIGMASGRFPDPPQSVIDWEKSAEGKLLEPRFRLRSRITTSIRQQRVIKLAQTLEMFAPVFQNDPKQAMRIDWNEAMPDIFRDSGLPENWIKPEEEFEQELKALGEMEAQSRAANDAATTARAMKDVSQAGPEGQEVLRELSL